jgi:predicted N-formylglutamate amidohydrolase
MPLDAVELVVAGDPQVSLALSCEHASEGLPEPWRWPSGDEWLLGTHWAFDLGAAELTRELARALEVPAVLSRFSRLFVDPNRAADEASLFRTEAEGRPVELNADLSEPERARRMTYYRAYHEALDEQARVSGAEVLLAIHSFTPNYLGHARDHIEVGVLFDLEDELGGALAARLAMAGFAVRLNEPYSGKEGMIYAASRCAAATGARALEIELRQDLAQRREVRAQVVEALARFDWPHRR